MGLLLVHRTDAALGCATTCCREVIYFLVYKCLRYRVRVVTENLRNSFPDRPEAELRRIRSAFYHNFPEIFISTVSQARMTDDRAAAAACGSGISTRCSPICADATRCSRRPISAAGSTIRFWRSTPATTMWRRLYHPLENKVIDAVYLRLRRRRNIRLIPMKEIIRYYIDHRLPAGAPGSASASA